MKSQFKTESIQARWKQTMQRISNKAANWEIRHQTRGL